MSEQDGVLDEMAYHRGGMSLLKAEQLIGLGRQLGKPRMVQDQFDSLLEEEFGIRPDRWETKIISAEEMDGFRAEIGSLNPADTPAITLDSYCQELDEEVGGERQPRLVMLESGRRTGAATRIRNLAAIAAIAASAGMIGELFGSRRGCDNPPNPWAPSPPRETDPEDQARIDAAEAKRQRKMAKRKPK